MVNIGWCLAIKSVYTHLHMRYISLEHTTNGAEWLAISMNPQFAFSFK